MLTNGRESTLAVGAGAVLAVSLGACRNGNEITGERGVPNRIVLDAPSLDVTPDVGPGISRVGGFRIDVQR
jgi:hypothetical protein